jgi:polyisoprenyl-phosphate glycosyltransferase
MEDLSIVIPVKDESHEIVKKTVEDLASLGAEVIVVDDGSLDPYPDSIKHGSNFGYGAALMTGIKNATRPYVLTCDGDGQHTAEEMVRLYHAYKLMPQADMVVGKRTIGKESATRFVGRKLLNWCASLVCMYWLPDLNSGARIFKRNLVIGYFPILCKTFSFTTSLTISMLCDGYRVEFFPINVFSREYGKSHVNVALHGMVTLFYILRNGLALRTRKFRGWMRQLRGGAA